jgi:uncharacterized protein DUF5681
MSPTRTAKPGKRSPVKSRRNAGQFRKGQSGNPAGRLEGVPNKATAEAKAVCALLVDDPTYRARLETRLVAGKLAPAVECMLWHYRFGKPTERVEVEAGGSLLELLAAATARGGA